MAIDTIVRARIDTATKQRATEALYAMGLTVSEAVRLLLVRIADEQRLPFEIRRPNAATRRAMEELEAGKGARSRSVKDLMRDLKA